MHLVSALQLVREEHNAESFDLVQSLPEFQELANLYEQYCKDENDGPLKMFWNSYLEMVDTTKAEVRQIWRGQEDGEPRGKSFVLRADRNLFARLLVIGQSRQIDLRDLLTHELGPVPWSLATYDGSLAKTNKSTLAKLLEDGVEILPNLPNASAVIIDAMALLQTLPRIPDRFIDLADLILSAVIKQAGEARRLDFVADQYPSISIKNIEREKRGRSGQLSVQIISPQQLCPRQGKKFLANGLNKTNLMEFLADVWGTDQRFAEKIGERTLFVTHGESCTKISDDTQGSISSGIVLELCSNQEEADTRMFLHALHASNAGHQQILIKSSDTDAEVLACYFRENITADIFLFSGTRSRARVIPVSQVCEQLGVEVCRALPGLHALTGCDTVSSFAGKGKKVALDILKADEGSRASILRIGERVPPMRRDLNEMEKFVCSLYNDVNCCKVNDTRYKLFCKNQNLQSYQLPPTHAALQKHLQRANYQAYVWKHALDARILSQGPDGQGWRVRGEELEIDWTDIAPAPESVMELVCCGCRGMCETRRCSCVKNELHCTDACSCGEECVNCDNSQFSDDEDDASSEEEDYM